MKKYLITGYSGFVSAHFLQLLEDKGERVLVHGVDINEPGNVKDYQFVQASFRKTDLLDKEAVRQLLSDFMPDYILHLASYSSVAYSWKHPAEAFVNNTNIFLNLADLVRTMEIKCRILSVGSSEEYGNIAPEQLPVKETAVPRPGSPYAVARLSQEMLSEIYAKNFGVDIVMSRSFNHIGPGQKDIFVISSFAKKLTAIKKNSAGSGNITVGNISLVRDFVDVRDVVEAYYLLFQKGKSGEVYNICSGIGTSLDDILRSMINILDIKADFHTDESLVRPGENKVIIGSPAKIQAAIGWKPTIALNESLTDIINYWMEKEQ